MVHINGKDEAADGMLLGTYLKAHGYPSQGIAVEINEEIVPKAEYDTYVFADNDVVEVVSFVGGG